MTGGFRWPAEAIVGRAEHVVDPITQAAREMSDDELKQAIRAIRGSSKRAGSRARKLTVAETLALSALMDEEARRV